MSKKRKPDQKPEETETFEEKFLKMSIKSYEMQHAVLSPEGVMEESITRSLAEKLVPRTIRQTSPSVSTVSINAVPEDPEEDYEAYMEQQKTLNELSNKYREEKKLTQGDQVRSILQSIVTERKPEAEQDLTYSYIDFAIVERGTVYIWMKRSIDPYLKQPLPDPVKRSVSAIGNRLYSFAHENAPFFLNPDGTVDGLRMITQFEAKEQAELEKREPLLYPAVKDHIIPNTLIGRKIFMGGIPLNEKQKINIAPYSKTQKAQVMTTVLLNFKGMEDTEDSKGIKKIINDLNWREQMVSNAISAIDSDLRQMCPGLSYPYTIPFKAVVKQFIKCEDPTENQRLQTLEALNSLRSYLCSLKYTPRNKSIYQNTPPIKELSDNLIHARIEKILNNDGTETEVITILSKPILQEYAEDMNQIIRMPTEYFKVKETKEFKPEPEPECKKTTTKAMKKAPPSKPPKPLKINGTLWTRYETPISMAGMRAFIVEYLILRIQPMYKEADKGKRVSKTIKTDSIYEIMGANLTRDQKLECRKFVEKALRSFCFDGIISDYTIETGTNSRAISAYKIVLSPVNPFINSD